jgi:DNA-binding NtrC family response regulator
MRQARILIVEDDPHMREGLTASIEKKGHKVEVACDALEAKLKLAGQGFDLVITDLRMPKGSGMDVLDCARDLQPATPVVVITAYGTVEKAVEAMKKGAVDFIQKPFSLTDLWETLDRCLGSRGAHGPDRAGSDPQAILTRNSQMLLILQRARAVAGTKVPVLLQGESGTGKELLARFIHRNSPRAHKPLVAVNCAAIPDNLLESELFGHEKGAFTGAVSRKIGKFEQANGSTLLLDEIGEMSLNLQAKLLRVLQEWEVDRLGGNGPIAVDVRVIATTNADLLEGVRNGKFREDLYFRLSVMPLRLPPLRERKEDIPLLAEHFLKLACREHSRSIRGFTPRAMEKLEGTTGLAM